MKLIRHEKAMNDYVFCYRVPGILFKIVDRNMFETRIENVLTGEKFWTQFSDIELPTHEELVE